MASESAPAPGPGGIGWASPALARYTPERIGMLSMLCLVVVFGVHSFVDWTWYVPGDACVALLCAGWLAGRGPLRASATGTAPARAAAPRKQSTAAFGARGARSLREAGPMRVGVAVAVVIAALLTTWSQWQPQRSADASQQALAALSTNPRAALAKAQTAVSRDPLSAQALFTLATVQQDAGEPALAKATLQRVVRLQPSNPQAWLALARYDLSGEPAVALKELQAAIYLNPELIAPEAIAPRIPIPNQSKSTTTTSRRCERLEPRAPPPHARAGTSRRSARKARQGNRAPARALPPACLGS